MKGPERSSGVVAELVVFGLFRRLSAPAAVLEVLVVDLGILLAPPAEQDVVFESDDAAPRDMLAATTLDDPHSQDARELDPELIAQRAHQPAHAIEGRGDAAPVSAPALRE